jgi:hypothetical protein
MQDLNANVTAILRKVLQKESKVAKTAFLCVAQILSNGGLLREYNRRYDSVKRGEWVSLSTISFQLCSLKLIS